MKPDAKIWYEQGEEHIKDAEYCLNGARYGLKNWPKSLQHFWRVRYPDIRLTKRLILPKRKKIEMIVKSFEEVYLWVKNKLKNI